MTFFFSNKCVLFKDKNQLHASINSILVDGSIIQLSKIDASIIRSSRSMPQ